jgi:multidrug efflux pump subunit AcrB
MNSQPTPKSNSNPEATKSKTRTGPIKWMAHNPVAANLLMIFFLVAGFFAAMNIKQEVFPEFDLDMVSITVAYPGASPEEIEKSIVTVIEDEVRGLEGVKQVTSNCSEGAASVTIELLLGTNGDRALQDIKNTIDRISTLPEDSERPVVSLLTTRNEVMTLAIYGDGEEIVIRDLANRIREDLLEDPLITYAEVSGVKPLEISIEISQENLRKYGLTLSSVATLIRRASVEIPGGGVKTDAGEILVRVAERRDWGSQFAELPVISRPDGTRVLLGEIATIRDDLAEDDQESFYNDRRAAMIKVYRVGDQTPLEVADAIKKNVEKLNRDFPENLSLIILSDRSQIYRERLSLLLRNAQFGLILVLLTLGFFLEIRLAFWVTMGIPISFMGAMFLLPAADVSINMISMFAFIVSLGIVVDDAIVVGENIYTNRGKGLPLKESAIKGTREVAMPVVFSVLTNMVAFMPMLFVTGFIGKIFKVIPVVVISVFAISLVEALFILPAHLAHSRPAGEKGLLGAVHKFQQKFSLKIEELIKVYYQPLLRKLLAWRYLTLSTALAIFIIVIGYLYGGHIGVQAFPKVAGDQVRVDLTMPFGTPIEETDRVQQEILSAVKRVVATCDSKEKNPIVLGVFHQIGSSSSSGHGGPRGSRAAVGASHLANVIIYLVPTDQRKTSTGDFEKLWRKEIGDQPGVESLQFKSSLGPGGGSALQIRLSHRDNNVLTSAALDLANTLRNYVPTITDIDAGVSPGKRQINFRLKPHARSLGIESSELARQLRASFYGAEAIRQQRLRDEIKVMVRLPKNQRCSPSDISDFIVNLPSGGEVPLREIATFESGRAYTSITRIDGRRIINVTADATPKTKARAVLSELKVSALDKLKADHPGLSYSLEGDQRDLSESFEALKSGLLVALLAIYAMLAIPFKSYIQPLIIMISIPFGIIGATIGHILMGFDLSIVSMLGMVALSGVVVNDSLVLIDFANRIRAQGSSALESITRAGVRRFRPIVLTSITTFGGLAPMIFETSRQARFLIPMAISLGYGILFATLIALLLVPALYLISDDVRQSFKRLSAFFAATDR